MGWVNEEKVCFKRNDRKNNDKYEILYSVELSVAEGRKEENHERENAGIFKGSEYKMCRVDRQTDEKRVSMWN